MSRFLLACFLVLLSMNAAAVCSSTPLAQEDAFRISALPLNDRSVEVRIAIEPCYLLYQNKLSFSLTPAIMQPFAMPIGTMKRDPFMGRVSVFRRNLSVILPFVAKPAGSKVTLRVRYQGCAEALGICFPRSSQILTFLVPRGTIPGEEVFAKPKPLFDEYTNPVFGTGL